MPLSNQRTIQVLIAGNRNETQCNVECGQDWATAETITLARERAQDRFGDRIQLEYVDLSQPIADERLVGLIHKAKQGGNPSFPLLIINGTLRISGPFDIRQLVDAIDAELELSHG
ncbi:MAG: hypothetical protein PHU08_01465 [Dehalococcoidales bacterium]|nr:hypothetical protein [Dehalococcoidales bacterium]